MTLARNRQTKTGRIQGNRSGSAGGNPEPSRRDTAGRGRDYLRARAPLMTGLGIPHPTSTAEGDEKVHAKAKVLGNVNPLVPGSSPGGPTTSTSGNVPRHHMMHTKPRYIRGFLFPTVPACPSASRRKVSKAVSKGATLARAYSLPAYSCPAVVAVWNALCAWQKNKPRKAPANRCTTTITASVDRWSSLRRRERLLRQQRVVIAACLPQRGASRGSLERICS